MQRERACVPFDDSVVCHATNLGPWTASGFRMLLAVWHLGGCVVIDTRPDAFKNFFRHPINLTVLTPEMLKLLDSIVWIATEAR